MVDGVSNTTSTKTSNTDSTTSKTSLGKDDFLKLMMAQLKYQDPLNPMDGTEYATQLAQFSSLEQLTNMNTSLNNSINANYLLAQSVNNTMAVSLIGKEIKLSGSTINYNGESNINLGYTLPSDAKNVTVNIYDSSGKLVKSVEESNTSSGTHKLSWDFTDNNGNKLSKGSYKYEVKATDYSNGSLTTEIFKFGVISSVKYEESGTKIIVGNSAYSLSDVAEVFSGTN
ncbi:MAG: flagellar hook capping FlgD N-terminal domain-containing protein [Bacteroidota bacterium]|nr:flagellar hook capping FlgD N-terminal domain-containing protein [Bacteroidota bacterium]MDP4192268.1 flagellar hook capping FlgD N-terminal domain-containing protein [Bacteroidota bacterium]MDP4195402.1 flagellar hook capping FlgD N-terminal domain-containing protein [Bacteroidota bacterium]